MNLSVLQIQKNKIDQFAKKGINSIEDLVNFLPRKYYDFTNPVENITLMEPNEMGCCILDIDYINKTPKVLQFFCSDRKGLKVTVLFFHMDYLATQFQKGDKVLVCGILKTDEHNASQRSIFNPLIFTKEIEKYKGIHPIYSAIKGMSSEFLENNMKKAINIMQNYDFLEPELQAKYNLWPNSVALKKLHFPDSMNEVDIAKKRVLFNDLFLFNYHMKEMTTVTNDETHIVIEKLDIAKYLISTLPYPLTASNGDPNLSGQKDVLNNMTIKMMQGRRVNALLQGDVGCGKTLVALLLMTIVSENGYQSVIVAPTNILAKQHYAEIKEKAEALGFKVGFLSSELTAKEQKEVIKGIENGTYNMIVGTHSLMSDKISFYNLGLSIVDEEHRFGVEQREKLNLPGVHKVSMSATPIPRSLAMSMYGDLIDVETINVLPAGRQELHTELVLPSENNKIYFHILEELQKGKQAYIVCPLKSESDSEKLEGVVDVVEEYNAATTYFSKHGFKVGMVTGATKASEVAENLETLNAFRNHEFDVLVATTIIEVGVNVPNATVILIKNAERFGFAQLHQLRGRVGRGKDESYCYLMTDNKNKFTIFAQTRDGFKIAEEDLRLRGAGSFLGTEQSGDNKYLMLIMANQALNELIKEDIDAIFADPNRKNYYYNLINIKEVSQDEDEPNYKKYNKKS